MVDPVGSQASIDRMLALSLTPSPFPFRRDIALDARLVGPGCGFADHFSNGPSGLSIVVAHLPGQELADVAAALLLRELLRAACRLHADAAGALDEALAGCRAVLAALPAIDCSLLRLDLQNRSIDVAVRGEGGAGASQTGFAPTLGPGRDFFLRAGLPGLTLGQAEPDAGPAEIATAALAGHPRARAAGGALVVLVGGASKAPADELTLSLANAASEVEAAQRAMEVFLDERGVPAETAAALTLAFDELFTNIVSYAFADGRRHEIVARLETTPCDVGLELRDDGSPFDPLSRGPAAIGDGGIDELSVGGLGLSFARQLADSLHYERAGGWNVLRWRKGLPTSA